MSSTKQVRYPWGKWFGKKRPYRLKRGEDFFCTLHGMSAQVRNRATKLGVRVSVTIDSETESLRIVNLKG